MRKVIGYTLIAFSMSAGLVFLLVSFCAMDELKPVFGFGSLGLLAAGIAICADEFFGFEPKKKK